MSTKVQKFHLSSECRYILYRLRHECQFLLDKDIVDGFPCETRCLGNLLPLLHAAYKKIWLPKDKFLAVKKPYRSFIGLCDSRQVLVDYEYLEHLKRDSAAYRLIVKGVMDDDDLPF